LSDVAGCGYEVTRLLRDKLAMRARQAQEPTGAVAAAPACSPESLAAFGEAHGYPFIVKPVEGVASMGVLRVDGPHELDAAWRHITDVRAHPLEAPAFGSVDVDGFIAEEYLDGDEVSVESFSFDGRHIVLSVTEKTTFPNFVEAGHALPARLDDDTTAEVIAATHAFLEMAGVRQGPSHTEMRLTGAGPRVVESHTRPGGDRIIEMVEAAYGVDQERYTVGWPCRAVPELRERPPARCAAATRFLTADPGTVQGIEGVDRVRAQPGVLLADVTVVIGDAVRPPAWSWDRPGQVIVTAPTTEEAVERCEALTREITIVTG
jgi:biotin carboxylase